jgi:hypothetical protein
MTVNRIVPVPVAGLAGGLAWILGLIVWFGPAQAILTDPARQSAKFLDVMGRVAPAPRAAAAPWIVPLGCLLMGMIHAAVYAGIRSGLGDGRLRRGLRFGVAAWALMAPWFELYLPWNAMHEPFPLVLLELALWLLVMLGVGVAVAVVHEALPGGRPVRPRTGAP